MTVATHLDLRSAHCANIAARSAAFITFWAGDVMVRVNSGTDTQTVRKLRRLSGYPSKAVSQSH
eukprot:3527626-Prymnesium_polylepis.1